MRDTGLDNKHLNTNSDYLIWITEYMGGTAEGVILVVIDALRRDRIGVNENRDFTLTTNIDSLANRGATFQNAFTTTNATDPSITSIHTGRDPSTVVTHHGPHVTDEEKRLAESVTSVPEVLQSEGVGTVAAGRSLARWHSSGFDEYPEEALDVRRRRSIGQSLERISPKLRSAAGTVYETVSGLYDTVAETNEVDDLLDSLPDGRFYGFVHMMDPHMPCDPDPDLVEDLLERREYPNRDLREFFEAHEDSPYVSEFLADVVTERDYEVGLARLFARYDGAVVEADRKVGQLVEGLREQGRLEDTTIVVTSDHGESLDEHGIYFDHHGLYDPSIRVPLVVAGEGVDDAVRDEFVQLPDLAPTTLDLLDVDRSLDGIGRSLTPLLGGDGSWEPREFVVVGEAQAQRRVGIRTDRYKFIKHVDDPVLEEKRGSSLRCGYCNVIHGGERELYDLERDPGETNDLVDEEPDRVEALDERLESYRSDLEHPVLDDADESVAYEDEEVVLDRLEDLGYK